MSDKLDAINHTITLLKDPRNDEFRGSLIDSLKKHLHNLEKEIFERQHQQQTSSSVLAIQTLAKEIEKERDELKDVQERLIELHNQQEGLRTQQKEIDDETRELHKEQKRLEDIIGEALTRYLGLAMTQSTSVAATTSTASTNKNVELDKVVAVADEIRALIQPNNLPGTVPVPTPTPAPAHPTAAIAAAAASAGHVTPKATPATPESKPKGRNAKEDKEADAKPKRGRAAKSKKEESDTEKEVATDDDNDDDEPAAPAKKTAKRASAKATGSSKKRKATEMAGNEDGKDGGSGADIEPPAAKRAKFTSEVLMDVFGHIEDTYAIPTPDAAEIDHQFIESLPLIPTEEKIVSYLEEHREALSGLKYGNMDLKEMFHPKNKTSRASYALTMNQYLAMLFAVAENKVANSAEEHTNLDVFVTIINELSKENEKK